jgi:hypothetical protein
MKKDMFRGADSTLPEEGSPEKKSRWPQVSGFMCVYLSIYLSNYLCVYLT